MSKPPDNIVYLKNAVVGDGIRIDPDKIVGEAAGKLRDVLVIGETREGELYVAGSYRVADAVLMLLRAARFFSDLHDRAEAP